MNYNRSEIFNVNITGHSMFPILNKKDVVVVKRSDIYQRGDIIVFDYGENVYIIHRILYCGRNSQYYCKGDNAFRIEIISEEDILGKVIFVKRDNGVLTLPVVADKFITLSLAVNQEFLNNHCKLRKTMKSIVYKEYIKERDFLAWSILGKLF